MAEGLLPGPDVFLVDVGASGGIDPTWLTYQSRLRAVGFDPLVNEVARLNQQPRHPHVKYIDAFVGAKDYDRLLPAELAADKLRSRSNASHPRSSSVRASQLGQMDYQKQVFNTGQTMVFSSRRLELDDYFQGSDRAGLDFLKIDTDGSDYQVLLGAQEIFQAGGVLGLSIECQFHGPVHDEANLFCNIDRFLRARGFSLYDLEVHRYSRAELPRPFVYDIPAQTSHGQVQWGEALYFRDLADPDYSRMWGWQFDIGRQIKLASLFELFNLQDCAVELLLRDRSAFEAVLPVSRCLDLLTPPCCGQPISYTDYQRQFADWASRQQWFRFGREPSGVHALACSPTLDIQKRGHQASEPNQNENGCPVGDEPCFDLGQRMAQFLGREEPVSPAELEETQTLLNRLLIAPDASRSIDKLRRQRKVPPALQPVLLYHLGVACKEGNALLAEVLELIYGRLRFDASL